MAKTPTQSTPSKAPPTRAAASAAPAVDSESRRAMTLLAQMIADGGEELAQQAPKQLEKMKKLLGELKAGRGKAGAGSQAAELVRDLFSWQLELTRKDYVERLAEVAPAVAAGNPTAVLAHKALDGVVRVLDEALSAMKKPGTPSTTSLEAAAARAAAALQEADAAILKANAPVVRPVRPTPGTPALVPVEPRPFAAARPANSSQVAAPAAAAPLKVPARNTPMPVKPRSKPAAKPPSQARGR